MNVFLFIYLFVLINMLNEDAGLEDSDSAVRTTKFQKYRLYLNRVRFSIRRSLELRVMLSWSNTSGCKEKHILREKEKHNSAWPTKHNITKYLLSESNQRTTGSNKKLILFDYLLSPDKKEINGSHIDALLLAQLQQHLSDGSTLLQTHTAARAIGECYCA